MRPFTGLRIKAFSDIIQASGILFLASVFANVCNLLFVLFMVRKLEPVEYGVLNTLFSLLMIFSMPAGTLQAVVTKFVAQFFANKDFAKIKCFLLHFGKRIFLFGVLFLIFFLALTPAICGFLKISDPLLIIITGSILFLSIVSPLTMGILQGTQRFVAMAVNGIFGSFLKLIIGAVLVVVGLKVRGALLGACFAALLALILSVFQFPKGLLVKGKMCLEQLHITSVYKYVIPVFFSLLGWMVLTNSDVILVKHFFSEEDAGFYSVAQLVGKIILFLPGVIGVVLFPKMSQAYSNKLAVLPLLKKGLLLTGFLCFGASVFCGLFPAFVLNILTHKQPIEAVRLVPLFCLAMTFYAMVNQLVFYNLSIHSFRFTIYLLLASLLQISLISFFHPSLSMVVFSLIISSLLLFFTGWFEAIRGLESR